MKQSRLNCFVLLVTLTAPAHAYLDPNSGGVLFQVLTPILAVIVATLGFARRQLSHGWLFLSNGLRNLIGRLRRSLRRQAE